MTATKLTRTTLASLAALGVLTACGTTVTPAADPGDLPGAEAPEPSQEAATPDCELRREGQPMMAC
jgi:hypothetical protein